MNSGKIVAGGWTDGTGDIEGSTRGPRGPKKIGRRGDVPGKLILDSRKGILKLKIRGKSNKKEW